MFPDIYNWYIGDNPSQINVITKFLPLVAASTIICFETYAQILKTKIRRKNNKIELLKKKNERLRGNNEELELKVNTLEKKIESRKDHDRILYNRIIHELMPIYHDLVEDIIDDEYVLCNIADAVQTGQKAHIVVNEFSLLPTQTEGIGQISDNTGSVSLVGDFNNIFSNPILFTQFRRFLRYSEIIEQLRTHNPEFKPFKMQVGGIYDPSDLSFHLHYLQLDKKSE